MSVVPFASANETGSAFIENRTMPMLWRPSHFPGFGNVEAAEFCRARGEDWFADDVEERLQRRTVTVPLTGEDIEALREQGYEIEVG